MAGSSSRGQWQEQLRSIYQTEEDDAKMREEVERKALEIQRKKQKKQDARNLERHSLLLVAWAFSVPGRIAPETNRAEAWLAVKKELLPEGDRVIFDKHIENARMEAENEEVRADRWLDWEAWYVTQAYSRGLTLDIVKKTVYLGTDSGLLDEIWEAEGKERKEREAELLRVAMEDQNY
ncbi:hypothetical protein BDV96DRAFT_646617 [Lophiotrema nucula]|uniref:Uncharacterized protein n=1 Tax=Lophiotrema nucula TaxID=690887 RepID=A0A6A5Z5I7_9PLEO|nr:hypothetical protein BDV96DRAFT_646617 [Lophiotrema nucula]